MLNSNDLLNSIRIAALNAVECSQPAAIIQGIVKSTDPISIQVDQNLILSDAQLIVAQHLKDYTASVTLDIDTSLSACNCEYSENSSHCHNLTGTHSITINTSLTTDDSVLLLRFQGGQYYYVLDKITNKEV